MKKNKILRIASCLLIAVLLSTCAISGTFAKYTTSDSAADTARVAKWGVTASITNGDVFNTTYASDTQGYTGNTVLTSVQDQKLVAPGTKNETGITLTIGGAPEVAVNVSVVLNIRSDVKLAAGTYTDNPTTGDPVADEYILAADYTPVVYTLTKDGQSFASGTLAQIKTAIEALSNNYAANDGLAAINGEYKLTWAWAYGTTEYANSNDVADTILGNAAVTPITGATTAIDFDLTVTITQIN